ncbi:hypothetical protein CFC21_007714 [Triticum aestivum]|uniref:Uncharacterized protein n=3 Tax=Triticum TaxID=4564 RepID=A0A9R0QZE2_TRITD|nr:uncharacterized protein LOC123093794 [Triticum aestivum]KAF6990539.1 hypothetical protein CFC21_007714 [Triticum aestivum]VAH20083.1 unnamed protein product [Triticum turgidum subsp. durum]
MEYEYQYSGGGGDGGSLSKEKRPPAKRGQVKLQMVRALSNLVSPSGAVDGSKQANRNSFRREIS